MVSSQGLEPRLKGPKPFVLPLDDKEMESQLPQHQERKKGVRRVDSIIPQPHCVENAHISPFSGDSGRFVAKHEHGIVRHIKPTSKRIILRRLALLHNKRE